MTLDDHDLHNNPKAAFSSGFIKFKENKYSFSEGTFFLHKGEVTEEQRACIVLSQAFPPHVFKDIHQPFGTLQLDKPIFVEIIPIHNLPIFLLSSTVKGNIIDLVISPSNEHLHKLLETSALDLIYSKDD